MSKQKVYTGEYNGKCKQCKQCKQDRQRWEILKNLVFLGTKNGAYGIRTRDLKF